MARWNPFGRTDKPSSPTDEQSLAEDAAASPSQPPLAANAESPSTDAPVESTKPTKSSPKRGVFGRLTAALKHVLNTDIRDLMKEGRIVDDAFLDELFAILIKTDMGAGPAGKIRDDIHAKYRARRLFSDDLIASAKSTIREIMQQDSAAVATAESGPTVIMVVGVNGAGKTTSIAKLTHRFTEQGKRVVLGAGDTFRAAAVEQLTIWAGRMNAEIVTGPQGSDPASVAYKAVEAAKNSNADVCIVDTAGRLQTQNNLMEELGRIRRVIGKVIPEAPHEVLLVLDATAGQNAISQARGFSDAAGCTGIVLAKLDGTAKGGVAIPIRQEFGLPVKFVGLGETNDALAVFDVDQFVEALFDGI